MLFSDDELLVVRRRRAEGFGIDDIAVELGRDRNDVQYAFKHCRDRMAALPRARRGRNVVRERNDPVVPADVLADRARRHSRKHETLTALVFGDPLPGCSALDLLKAGQQCSR